jgi:nitroimidazol reductase NimA-like FMN-containing flavoprotein (pyridoxamine 5'-phosphate oxidase superfamily)
MFENDQEIAELQHLFDETLISASPHMRNIVNPRRRLSAPQVVAYLQGTKYIAFVAVGPEGEPHVSPLDAVFIHGRFTMSTSARADKVRHLRANPKCSAVHMDGDRIAMVASGTVEWIARDHPDHELIHRTWTEIYESDPYTWGDVVLFRLQPALMWAYAFRPEEFSAT